MKSNFNVIFIIGIVLILIESCNKESKTTEPVQQQNTINNSVDTGRFTDNRDNNIYKWVKIGDQIWMSENLAYKIDTGGCWAYDEVESYADMYGYLYSWWSAKAAVPEGWHLPTDSEWTELENFLSENGYSYNSVIGSDSIAKSIASGWWDSSNTPGSLGDYYNTENINKSGFSGLSGGTRSNDNWYFFRSAYTAWWSDTEYNSKYIYYRSLNYSNPKIGRSFDKKDVGLYVRCIKD